LIEFFENPGCFGFCYFFHPYQAGDCGSELGPGKTAGQSWFYVCSDQGFGPAGEGFLGQQSENDACIQIGGLIRD
jgi:hypothetical protein